MQVTLTPLEPTPRGGRRWRATLGKPQPVKPPLRAADVARPRKGERNVIPRGTDQRSS